MAYTYLNRNSATRITIGDKASDTIASHHTDTNADMIGKDWANKTKNTSGSYNNLSKNT